MLPRGKKIKNNKTKHCYTCMQNHPEAKKSEKHGFLSF